MESVEVVDEGVGLVEVTQRRHEAGLLPGTVFGHGAVEQEVIAFQVEVGNQFHVERVSQLVHEPRGRTRHTYTQHPTHTATGASAVLLRAFKRLQFLGK